MELNLSNPPPHFGTDSGERSKFGESICRQIFLGYARSDLLHNKELKMAKYNERKPNEGNLMKLKQSLKRSVEKFRPETAIPLALLSYCIAKGQQYSNIMPTNFSALPSLELSEQGRDGVRSGLIRPDGGNHWRLAITSLMAELKESIAVLQKKRNLSAEESDEKERCEKKMGELQEWPFALYDNGKSE
jgi:hypothetical protein